MEKYIINEIVNDYITKGSDAFSVIYNQNNTLVIEHPKYPKYLLKLSKKNFKSSQIQSNILSSISNKNNNISRILYTQIYEDNGNKRTMEIIDKLNGKPKKEYSNYDIENVIHATKQLHNNLNENKIKYREKLPFIGDLFSSIVDNTASKKLKSIANRIQNDYAYEKILDIENQFITIADLVYENILIYKDTINFIDLDPIILGPKELQFSILLTSNLLIQSNQFMNLNMKLIKSYANLWGFEKTSREDLISLTIFPLLILAMKQVDIDSLIENTDSMYFKLKTILLFIVDKLYTQ